jgi:hypothetical protein
MTQPPPQPCRETSKKILVKAYSLEEFGISGADLSRELGPILERFEFRPEDVPPDRTTEVL